MLLPIETYLLTYIVVIVFNILLVCYWQLIDTYLLCCLDFLLFFLYFHLTDPKAQRKPNGEKLYMFVARVLLGEPHLCQKPYNYKKAPCSEATCQMESCLSNHLPCDSVIGTHNNGPVRLLFREFIIYHTEQCYPEFLVEYVRQ